MGSALASRPSSDPSLRATVYQLLLIAELQQAGLSARAKIPSHSSHRTTPPDCVEKTRYMQVPQQTAFSRSPARTPLPCLGCSSPGPTHNTNSPAQLSGEWALPQTSRGGHHSKATETTQSKTNCATQPQHLIELQRMILELYTYIFPRAKSD